MQGMQRAGFFTESIKQQLEVCYALFFNTHQYYTHVYCKQVRFSS